MRKLRLRKWVKIVLSIILIVDLFFMILESDSDYLLFIKTLITLPIAVITFMILSMFTNLSKH